MKSARSGLALVISLFWISGPTAYAATEDDKIVPADTSVRDLFGFSAAVSGTTAVVGAIGPSAGAAYAFDCSSLPCIQLSKLVASDAAFGDSFGNSVAVSGTTAVVGARSDDDAGSASGSAYYFDLSTCGPSCTETSKLTASDARRATFFGQSVSVSGTTAVVGVFSSESAYYFDLSACGTACTEISKLIASDGVLGDKFGIGVAISGSTVVVGAPLDDDVPGDDSGSAYVFDCSSQPCVEVSKLTASAPTARELFGESVAVSGTTVVVGTGTQSESAYYFDLSTCGATCTETSKLIASDAATGDLFGHLSVAVSGTTAVVGARGDDGLDDGTGERSGAAYHFDLSTCGAICTETSKLTASDARSLDALGAGVGVSGTTAVAGAPSCGDCVLPGAGAAYVFELVDPDGDGDGVPDDLDVCPDTVIPEGVPTRLLGVNRWALMDGDGIFDTTPPPGGGDGPPVGFAIDDTGGCSCEQIIAALGLGKGHVKNGCSISAMQDWVALVNP